MNKLAIFAITILLICGGALWFLASGSLNDYVKVQIERVGQATTDQKVSVEKVEILLSKGAGTLSEIKLNNPVKYNYPHAITLKTAKLDINLKSLTQDTLTIDEILIEDAKAFVEFNKGGKSNIKELLAAIKKNSKKEDAADSQQNKDDADNSQQLTSNIRISKLNLTGVAMSLNLTELGNKEHTFVLPNIAISDIGGESGMPANQLGAEIIKRVLKAISKAATKEEKKIIKSKLKDKISKKLTDLFG